MCRKQRETVVSQKQQKWPTLDQVREVIGQYADSPLECDGLTNVLHFYLAPARASITALGCDSIAMTREDREARKVEKRPTPL